MALTGSSFAALLAGKKVKYEIEVKEIYKRELQELTDEFIKNLNDRNPELGRLMNELWNNIKKNPKLYAGTTVSSQLEKMVNNVIEKLLKDFCSKWYVNYVDLKFLATNYNLDKDRQVGEAVLKSSANFAEYKENTENSVSKLKYWKTVKEAYTEMIVNNILPLRDRE